MASPGKIYHNSGNPPVLYYQGKQYIGGTVSYDRTVALLTVGKILIGENKGSNICDLTGTITPLE